MSAPVVNNTAQQKLIQRDFIDNLKKQKFGADATNNSVYPGVEIDQFLSENAAQRFISWVISEGDTTPVGMAKKIDEMTQRLNAAAKNYQEFVFTEGERHKILQKELNANIDISEAAKAAQLPQAPQTTFFSSVFGGTKEARRSVRQGEVSGQPDKKLTRNLIFDARQDCLSDMRRDELELMAAIEGRELSKDEKRSIEKITTGKAARVSRNLSEAAAVAAFKVVDIAGRGIITKGTPTEHEFFRNYDQKKNELISLYAPQITGNEARSVFSLNLLKHAYRAHYEKLKKEGLPLPAGSPDQYDTLIDEKIGKIEKINNTALKEFNNHVNDLNQKALEESEGLTDAEDNMRKFRILQIFLMASPLGLFNFLGPITQALAPFMDGGTTFAQNMASLVTSDVFGPFGWLADTIELDVMIEGAFKLPGIEQAGELIKEGLGVLDNFSDLVGPTLGGGDPLLPLAIATVFSIRRFGGPELDYYNKYHAAKKSHGEKLQKAFENFVSGKSQYDPDKKGSGFTVHATDEERKVIKGALGEHIDEMAELSLIADLGEFISSQVKEGNAGNLAIFNGFKIKCDVDGTAGELSLSELAAKDVDFSRSSNVSDFLSALTEDNLKAMVKKMLVFESDEIGKRLDRFDAISNPELEAEGQKLFQSAQCAKIIDLAKDRGVTSSSPQGASLSDIAQNCKEKITAQEIEKWERMRNILRRPGKSPKDPEAKSMHNDLLASFQTGAKL